jgi:hypothetical protein
MPPDGEHLSRWTAMYQWARVRERCDVASYDETSSRNEGKERENHRSIKASRRGRDLVVAALACLFVSYLISCFRLTPDLFGTSLTVMLEELQRGVPSLEAYQRASATSDILQVVNTRYVPLVPRRN